MLSFETVRRSRSKFRRFCSQFTLPVGSNNLAARPAVAAAQYSLCVRIVNLSHSRPFHALVIFGMRDLILLFIL